ncbi:MAG: hypothetical protein MJD61_07770 [Proteobacteria bacterium]|nr:hypothetical protein [Pseudomonadota bacterium]
MKDEVPGQSEPPQDPARRPYEPPAIEESAQFSVLALGCDIQPGVCEFPDTPSASL